MRIYNLSPIDVAELAPSESELLILLAFHVVVDVIVVLGFTSHQQLSSNGDGISAERLVKAKVEPITAGLRGENLITWHI